MAQKCCVHTLSTCTTHDCAHTEHMGTCFACREAILSDMVRLKHGNNIIVSNKLFAEANVSLSESIRFVCERQSVTQHSQSSRLQPTKSLHHERSFHVCDHLCLCA